MSYKFEFRHSIYNLIGQIVNLFLDPYISRTTNYRGIRGSGDGIPSLNLPKSGRLQSLAEYIANVLMEK